MHHLASSVVFWFLHASDDVCFWTAFLDFYFIRDVHGTIFSGLADTHADTYTGYACSRVIPTLASPPLFAANRYNYVDLIQRCEHW